MAEALSLECPPTQDASQMNHSRIREFLKKQQHRRAPSSTDSHGLDTESGNSGDEQQRAQDNQSPPPNCSICLGRVKSKCFTDSCMHQFCFSCLLEWSKVKPECPLCKQTFKSIIHNVTSMDSYEEYKVEEQQRHVNWINLTNNMQPLDFILSAGLPTYRLAINRVPRPELPLNRFFHLFQNETPLTERFARTYPNDAVPPRYSGATWRAYCYDRRLHAIPINGSTFGPHGPLVRTVSAQFYRENPAQLHRLIPWLNRELVALFPRDIQSIPLILQSIERLLQTNDMTSREFRRRIRALIPNHTDHFIHELLNFARSPYDMVGYDRNVAYNPVFEDELIIMLSSSSSDESDVELVDMRVSSAAATTTTTTTTTSQSTATQNTASTSGAAMAATVNSFAEIMRRNLRTLPNRVNVPIVTPPSVLALEDDETDSGEEEITNYLHTKPSVSNEDIIRGRTDAAASPAATNDNNNQSSSRTSDQSVIVALNRNSSVTHTVPPQGVLAVVVTHSGATVTNTSEPSAVAANNSDSDSDECQFVWAKKPPHLRTPEYVELNSESDSDVVFVDETVPSGQAIKVESNGKSKTTSQQNIIMPSAGPSTVSSTNLIVSISRRKRRHNNDDDSATTASNQIEQSPQNYTSAACATICETAKAVTAAATTATSDKNAIDIKPSTSGQWRVAMEDRPNAIVFNRNSNARAIAFMARKSAGGVKRIYEASSSSDDEKSTDAELASSSSMSNSSSDSADLQSSSHEEYVVSTKTSKRKANTEASSQTMRKRYRKKANVKQIAARKKKKSISTIKPKCVPKNRNQRLKMPIDSTSSSENSSADEHSD